MPGEWARSLGAIFKDQKDLCGKDPFCAGSTQPVPGATLQELLQGPPRLQLGQNIEGSGSSAISLIGNKNFLADLVHKRRNRQLEQNVDDFAIGASAVSGSGLVLEVGSPASPSSHSGRNFSPKGDQCPFNTYLEPTPADDDVPAGIVENALRQVFDHCNTTGHGTVHIGDVFRLIRQDPESAFLLGLTSDSAESLGRLFDNGDFQRKLSWNELRDVILGQSVRHLGAPLATLHTEFDADFAATCPDRGDQTDTTERLHRPLDVGFSGNLGCEAEEKDARQPAASVTALNPGKATFAAESGNRAVPYVRRAQVLSQRVKPTTPAATSVNRVVSGRKVSREEMLSSGRLLESDSQSDNLATILPMSTLSPRSAPLQAVAVQRRISPPVTSAPAAVTTHSQTTTTMPPNMPLFVVPATRPTFAQALPPRPPVPLGFSAVPPCGGWVAAPFNPVAGPVLPVPMAPPPGPGCGFVDHFRNLVHESEDALANREEYEDSGLSDGTSDFRSLVDESAQVLAQIEARQRNLQNLAVPAFPQVPHVAKMRPTGMFPLLPVVPHAWPPALIPHVHNFAKAPPALLPMHPQFPMHQISPRPGFIPMHADTGAGFPIEPQGSLAPQLDPHDPETMYI